MLIKVIKQTSGVFKLIVFLLVFWLISACAIDLERKAQSNHVAHNNSASSFVSITYLPLVRLGLGNTKAENVNKILDRYRWQGLTEVVFIGGVFMAGQDGSLVYRWRKSLAPPPFEGVGYYGDRVSEKTMRSNLIDRDVIVKAIAYFKEKGVKVSLAQTGLGWMNGGSLGIVASTPNMVDSYTTNLVSFAKELGFDRIDFDWEYPATQAEGDGYADIMRQVKQKGMPVSVCVILPFKHEKYSDLPVPASAQDDERYDERFMNYRKLISEGMIDRLHVMHYLAYDEQVGAFTLDKRHQKMALWEKAYPELFQENATVDILSGIGFNGFRPAHHNGGKKATKAYGQLYQSFGRSKETQACQDSYCFWTPSDVYTLVHDAHARGWKGVFTWAAPFDVEKDVSDDVSLQSALEKAFKEIKQKRHN